MDNDVYCLCEKMNREMIEKFVFISLVGFNSF